MVVDISYIVILIIVFTMVILFALLAYRTFVQKIISEKTQQCDKELEYQKEMALQASSVQESERKRIAELLHDDVGNRLNILSLWINNEDTWNNKRSKEVISQQIPELIEAIRTISHSLYPSNLEKFGLILTLEALIANIDESLSVELILNKEYEEREITLEIQLYRIIQEFLSNVIKHARASEMLINIRDTEQSLVIILSDNGIGFDTKALQEGMGLKNIESRLQSIEAKSKWKSKKNDGSRLIIILPKNY